MTYIVAEIGINHDGSKHRLDELVDAARGCDAVKFQLFHPDLIERSDEVKSILWKCYLDECTIQRAANRVRKLGMETMVTPFGPMMLTMAEHMNCWDGYKVSHAESHDAKWIERLKGTGKPVFVSYCHDADIRDDVFQLWCCPDYPTSFDSVDWRAVGRLRGFSDHTGQIRSGAMAVRSGADVIEAHITWSKSADGPDHSSSLEPGDFAEYVRTARLVNHDQMPRNPLIDQNIDVPYMRAKCFARKHPGTEWRDYLTSGYIGLDRAANSFNASFGAAFRTYAHRKASGAILDQWKDDIGRSRQQKFERSIVDFSSVEAFAC